MLRSAARLGVALGMLLAQAGTPATAALTLGTSRAMVGQSSDSSAPPPVGFIATARAQDYSTLFEVDRMDPSTGVVRRLTGGHSSGGYNTLAWSAALRRLVYAYFYVVPVGEGSQSIQGEADSVDQDGTSASTQDAPATSLDVTPDGSRFVYSTGPGRDAQPGANGSGLYVRAASDSSGSAGTQILSVGGAHETRVSPDGQRVVLDLKDAHTGVYSLYIINIDGTGFRRVTGLGDDISATFSPDSQRLLFERLSQGVGTLYSVGTDGKNLRRVAVHAGSPDWASNGWLVYYTLHGLVLRSPGIPGAERRLPETDGNDHVPRFIR